jgi:3-oxoacyl-[acyl-carrier protein] reductase
MNSSREILKALLPGMLDRKFGRVVAISSTYATVARGGRSSYSISKAALEALIRSIAVEYAQCNIIANSIVPGFIETPLTLKNNTQLQIDKILERIPMRRFGSSVEVANLVSFLISEKNTYITGQSIRIDGGFSIN